MAGRPPAHARADARAHARADARADARARASARARATTLALLGALVGALVAAPAARAQAQQPASAPTGTVRGVVRHVGTGAPMPGVQLTIAGTRVGALSKDDGTYAITGAPAGAQRVQARLIGYTAVAQNVAVPAGGSIDANFTLVPATVTLDEVVVTGTAGNARRREVGNSISAVKTADAPEAQTNVSSLLQGRIAGASVQLSGGSAGAGASIRLRGNSSVALSNQPLVYIDGVRVRSDEYPKNQPVGGASPNLRGPNVYASPLNDIDPSTVERVEVIKGAAATTLYGTEAAAGVIQIFTKKGQAGKAQWTFQTGQGFNRLRPFGVDAVDPTDTLPNSCASRFGARECSRYLYTNPWLRDGRRQQYLGTVSGGAANGLRYFVSGGYDDNQGVLPKDAERKYTVRGNFGFQPSSRLTFEFNTAFTTDSISNTPAGNNAAGITLNAFRRNRNYFASADIDTISQVLTYDLNTWISHLTLGGTVSYAPITSMTNKFTVGLDRSELENRNLRPYGFVSLPTGGLSDRHWSNQLLTGDYVGNYEHDLSLGVKIHTTTAWGGQLTMSDLRDLQTWTENFPGPGVPTVSSGSQWIGVERRVRIVTGGMFFQEQLGWRDRLFVNAGARFDKYSAFGSNLGVQAYPKVSASYVISDEDFFPQAFGSLKLRAAFGQAGRAPGAFDALRTYNPVSWGGQPGFRSNTVGNPDLGPERTTETELGFDAATLGGRLSVDLTYYDAQTNDALLPVRQIPSLGFLGSQLQNVGTLEKRGLEVGLNGDVFRSRPLTWNAGVTLALSRSRVASLGNAPSFSVGNYGWIVKDKPVAVVRGRIVKNAGEIADPVYETDHDFGPSQPTRIIGVSSALHFPGGVELSARGEYQGGFYINEDASYEALSRAVRWPTCFGAYNRQTSPTDVSTWSAWERATCANVRYADLFIFPGDFFKLRDVTLRAPVPQRVLARAGGVQSATLSVSVQNWYRWVNKDFRVFDPEMAGNDGFNATVRYISEHIPSPATVLASLKVTF